MWVIPPVRGALCGYDSGDFFSTIHGVVRPELSGYSPQLTDSCQANHLLQNPNLPAVLHVIVGYVPICPLTSHSSSCQLVILHGVLGLIILVPPCFLLKSLNCLRVKTWCLLCCSSMQALAIYPCALPPPPIPQLWDVTTVAMKTSHKLNCKFIQP